MKVEEYLKNLKVGEIVGNKRALAAMKRKGLVYDYSYWCYLEDQKVYYTEDYGNGMELCHKFTYMGKPIEEGEKGSRSNPFKSFDEYCRSPYSESLTIEYKGMKFRSKYLDGCFNAYLMKEK